MKEMGIPEHLTCLLRNLYAGQEATVRTGHGTTDWFQIGKGVHQGCILPPCLFNFFFKKIFNFFYFTILYWFCHTLTWIHHRCTWVPNPEPPTHHLPHIIPLGHPSAPAPSILYPVSNLDWRFVSYMIVYMFQCHSPKSSHPLPLPQSPKVCSIHLCLFYCLAYRVIITIFLNSIYMC